MTKWYKYLFFLSQFSLLFNMNDCNSFKTYFFNCTSVFWELIINTQMAQSSGAILGSVSCRGHFTWMEEPMTETTNHLISQHAQHVYVKIFTISVTQKSKSPGLET